LCAPFNLDDAWRFLLTNYNKGYLLTAGSQSSDKGMESKSSDGIISSHAYGILNIQEVQSNGQTARILQMRNPWGKGEVGFKF
jgi:hypothetical protein